VPEHGQTGTVEGRVAQACQGSKPAFFQKESRRAKKASESPCPRTMINKKQNDPKKKKTNKKKIQIRKMQKNQGGLDEKRT